jgi:pimeloyl-ACP methyl ester carboxylesterase
MNPTHHLPPPSSLRLSWSEQGSGPAVVLLHSSLGSKSQWRGLAERLARTHRTLAIDLLGYGDAPAPGDYDGFSLDVEVQRVLALVAQRLRPGERFQLVGHSYGGGVALRLAQTVPQRVASLALFEPTAFHLVPDGDAAIAEVRAVADSLTPTDDADERMAQTERFMDFWNGTGSFAALPEARRAGLARLIPKARYDFRALLDDPQRAPALARLRVPTCLIVGGHSPACARRVAAVLEAALPIVQTHHVPTGHMGPVTHPELVNPFFEAWLRRPDAYPRSRASDATALAA